MSKIDKKCSYVLMSKIDKNMFLCSSVQKIKYVAYVFKRVFEGME